MVTIAELWSCVNREVGPGLSSRAILLPSLISRTVSVAVKHYERKKSGDHVLSCLTFAFREEYVLLLCGTDSVTPLPRIDRQHVTHVTVRNTIYRDLNHLWELSPGMRVG